MSNARSLPSRRGRGSAAAERPRGGAPRTGFPVQQPAVTTAGLFSFPRKEKDSFRSKLRELTDRYRPICSEPPSGQRFRVRGEILPDGEDYFTVEFHCKMEGVIDLPWAEYSSADLQIRYGSALGLVRQVHTAVRRAPERLGIDINVYTALKMRGKPSWDRLQMSSKDFKALPREERERVVQVETPKPRTQGSSSKGFYEARAASAKSEMEAEASRPTEHSRVESFGSDHSRESWSDQVEREIPLPKAPSMGKEALAPHFNNVPSLTTADSAVARPNLATRQRVPLASSAGDKVPPDKRKVPFASSTLG